jgi:hypothetical protein
MKSTVLVLLAAVGGLVMATTAASAKSADDRFCRFSLTDEQGGQQTILFKLKKHESIDDELKKIVQADGGTVECGAEMRAVHRAYRDMQSHESLARHRLMFPAGHWKQLRPPMFPRSKLPKLP